MRPEFAGLPGKEIARLRLSGTPVTETVVTPVLAFVCDTSIEVLERAPAIISYPVVIIECSASPCVVGFDPT